MMFMLRDIDKTPVTEHALPPSAVRAIPRGWCTETGRAGGEVAVPGMVDRLVNALERRGAPERRVLARRAA